VTVADEDGPFETFAAEPAFEEDVPVGDLCERTRLLLYGAVASGAFERATDVAAAAGTGFEEEGAEAALSAPFEERESLRERAAVAAYAAEDVEVTLGGAAALADVSRFRMRQRLHDRELLDVTTAAGAREDAEPARRAVDGDDPCP
jgi:hypothetical protein